MKAVIAGVICRVLAYIAILAFVFGLIYISKNYNYLWFLFLLITCEFIPIYTWKEEHEKHNKNDKDNNENR